MKTKIYAEDYFSSKPKFGLTIFAFALAVGSVYFIPLSILILLFTYFYKFYVHVDLKKGEIRDTLELFIPFKTTTYSFEKINGIKWLQKSMSQGAQSYYGNRASFSSIVYEVYMIYDEEEHILLTLGKDKAKIKKRLHKNFRELKFEGAPWMED